MADLGEFGRALIEHDTTTGDAEPDTFRFHGEVFEVPPLLSPLPMMRFAWRQKFVQAQQESADAARDRVKANLAAARSATQRAALAVALDEAEQACVEAQLDQMAAMYEFMAGCMPDAADWERFQRVALRDHVQADELMEVCSAIFAAVVGGPSSRPSESSGGPSTTGGGSTGSYASQAPMRGLPSPPTDTGPLQIQEWQLPEPPAAEPAPRLSARERQKRAHRALMVPVEELLRSSG